MPMTTFLGPDECTEPTSSSEINELLAEIREVTGEDWRVKERTWTVGHLWWKRIERRYWLHVCVGGAEFQVINLVSKSIGMGKESEVANFMIGYLSGMEAARKGPR